MTTSLLELLIAAKNVHPPQCEKYVCPLPLDQKCPTPPCSKLFVSPPHLCKNICLPYLCKNIPIPLNIKMFIPPPVHEKCLSSWGQTKGNRITPSITQRFIYSDGQVSHPKNIRLRTKFNSKCQNFLDG